MDCGTRLARCMAQAGIALFGVCDCDASLLRSGYRADRLPKDAKSVVTAAFPYFVRLPERRNLSLYSMLPDYHGVVGGMLGQAAAALTAEFPGHAFTAFVDASPLREVEAARRAGLGAVGQNGQLLCPPYGAFVFLGTLVTDLALPAGIPAGGCERCGACIAACPAGALSERGLDASRCRSAITQKKGTLSEREAAQVADGGLAWGCDCCLLACPHNRGAVATPIAAFSSDIQPLLTEQNLDVLLQNRAFAWRGRAVLERNLSLLHAALRA